MGAIAFVTGGARSGKSRHAEALAERTGAPVVYIATMEPLDEELAARVALHQSRRPTVWTTVEEPLEIATALARVEPGATVLLDCVSLWVSNLIFATIPDAEAASAPDWARFIEGALGETAAMLDAQERRTGRLILVTNEVGSGIVPGDPLSRHYRDALGLANQECARAADEAWLLLSGLPVRLK